MKIAPFEIPSPAHVCRSCEGCRIVNNARRRISRDPFVRRAAPLFCSGLLRSFWSKLFRGLCPALVQGVLFSVVFPILPAAVLRGACNFSACSGPLCLTVSPTQCTEVLPRVFCFCSTVCPVFRPCSGTLAVIGLLFRFRSVRFASCCQLSISYYNIALEACYKPTTI